MNETLELKLSLLPDSPGCYLMKSQGKIIYVGKAVNLKNRVRQYFHPSKNHTPKVRAMVEKIDDFDIMLVDGELEAFLLECNLIKLHMPRYNILLKDDKHYPYIRIDPRVDFPKVELVRKMDRDGARYFGPYQGATVVREVMDVVRMVFPIRTCNRRIDPARPQRPCVHHQIGQCLAPCAGKVSSEEYRALIGRVMDFLGGKYAPVVDELTQRMQEASRAMNYERAALYRDRLRAVEAVMQKQKTLSTAQADQDVLAVAPYGADAIVELLMIRSGRLIDSEHFVFDGAAEDAPWEILTQFILQYYDKTNMPPQELLLSVDLPEKDVLEQLLTELHGRRVYLNHPMRGDKVKLVNMALKNLKDEAAKRDKQLARTRERTVLAMEELGKVLGLDKPPRRIEGYDISNTQGGAVRGLHGGDDRRGLRPQGVSPFPHQNRGRPQRFRLHEGGHYPATGPRRPGISGTGRGGAAPGGWAFHRSAGSDPHRRRPGPIERRPGSHGEFPLRHSHVRPGQAH